MPWSAQLLSAVWPLEASAALKGRRWRWSVSSQHDALVRVCLGLGGVLGVLAVASCHLAHKLYLQRSASPELRIDESGLLEVGKRRSSSGGGPLHHLSVDAGYW